MRYLRTNTAVRVTVGPFFSQTDGVTPKTSLTVTSCKLTFVVDDANVPTLVLDTNPTASGGSNDMVHITGDDAGFYDLELAAANVNYLGRAMLALTDATNHCPVFHEFMIIPAVVYDAMILGTDLFDVSVTQILGTAVSTPATAGILDVNVKNINNVVAATPGASGGVLISGSNSGTTTLAALTVSGATTLTGAVTASSASNNIVGIDVAKINAVATSSVTTISANVGTTQPVNYTGTGASALVKSDVVDIAGAAVSASTAQLGVNVVNYGGSAGTFSGGRPEVNAARWNGGVIPAVNVTGVPIVDASYILGTGISTPATAGILDVNVKRINNVTSATPGASGGLIISGSNAGTTTFAALTITGTLTASDGIVVNRSTSNATGIVVAGNGTGSGASFTSGSGATGDGVKMVAASTVGNGLTLTGTSTGYDFNLSTPDTNIPGLTTPPTAAAIATAVWQDATGADFTTISSIGKALYPDGSGYPSINVKSINSSTNAAANQQAALDVMYQGSVTGSATTTTLIDSGLTYVDADHWKGRCLIFLSDSTIKQRATVITAYDAGTKQLTFSAIGLTPAAGNTYIII